MDFTDDALNELRAIYREVFGEDITIEEARQMGLQLVLLYEHVARPLPRQSEKGENSGATIEKGGDPETLMGTG